MKRVVDRIQWYRKQWAHRRLAAGVPCWSLDYGSSARAADRLMRPLGG